jgi:hypothetical protein
VASLQSSTHNVNITRAVESVIASAIRHLNQLFLDALASKLRWVDEICCAELLRPFLLGIIDIDHDDARSLVLGRTLDNTQTNTASAEYGDVGTFLDTAFAGSDSSRTVAGRDAAAEQAGAVHGRFLCDSDDRDVGNDGVLGEGGGSHEVEQVFAFALEARGAVRHDAFALGGADLATEVGLSGLAELALAAFGGAVAVSFQR